MANPEWTEPDDWEAADASDGAPSPDVRAEFKRFADWWGRTIPHEPVPNVASHYFGAWIASVRAAGLLNEHSANVIAKLLLYKPYPDDSAVTAAEELLRKLRAGGF